MEKTWRQRILELIGIVGIVGILGFGAFGLFHALYWDPRHRPVVVTPPPGGGTITVDGAAVCGTTRAYTDEASMQPCRVVLTTGEHTVETKDASGAALHHDVVTVLSGESTFVYAPELPSGQCLEIATYSYAEIVIPILGGGPAHAPVAKGFSDVGAIDFVFAEPPKKVSSTEKDAKRTALRMVPCAP